MIAPRRGADVSPAHHGGRAGVDRAVRHDFSVCLNAFGTAGLVLDAIRNAPADEYPDPTSRLAREAAADAWMVPIESLMLGAGSAELIDLICRGFVASGDVVAIDSPAFGEYERAARIYGATVVPAMDDRAHVVFVCSPSNPLGHVRTRDELRLVADRCAARGALLVVDQAYDAFTHRPTGTPALAGHPSVLHLRSLTKEHALAGVRVAFAVGEPQIIDAMNSVRVPWSASSIAQCAAAASFRPEAKSHVEATTLTLRQEAARLRASLAAVGYETNGSLTHFFTITVRDAALARCELLSRFQILVRDCASFGLPDQIRVAARQPHANDDLIDAMTQAAPMLLP